MKISVTKNGNFIEERLLAGEQQARWSFLIGRSPECEIVLDDRKVSREHAKVTCENGVWMIEKTSDNGDIFINGKNVAKQELVQGDMINLGYYVLNISMDETDEKKHIVNEDLAYPEMVTDEVAKIKNSSKSLSNIESDPVEKNSKIKSYTADLETISNFQNNMDELPASSQLKENNEFPKEEPNVENDVLKNDNFEDLNNQNDFELSENLQHEDPTPFVSENLAEKTEVAKSFSKFILKIFGENAPYEKFILDQNEVKIGRNSERCQIVLNDDEVSSEHAIIRKTKNSYILEDLKSANGTILNGIRVNQSELANDDEFLIGSTTFTVEIISTFLQDQKDRLMPVEDNQVVEVEEIVEVSTDFVGDAVAGISAQEAADLAAKSNNKSLFTRDALKDPVKRKKILIILLVIVGLWILLGGEDKQKVSKTKNTTKQNYLLEQDKTNLLKDKKEIKLTPEQQESAEALYELSKTLLDDGKYKETLQELDKLHQIISPWKNSTQIYSWAQGGLKKLEEEEKKKQEEIERRIRKQKVKELVKQAQEAVKERHVEVAETLFSEIMKLEPENYDVTYMKATLEAWKKEEEKKLLEEEQKKAEKARNIRLLKPGKQFYLKKDWHKAIVALEKFLSIPDMDDDLVKQAHSMLTDSRKNLREIIEPLMGKARSLKEGQDLKGSYETYLLLLSLVPDNMEALKEMAEIRDVLSFRTKKVYREALILESMSLFTEAKDKFQEVQQITPSDSEYYRKATKKLQDYME
ncbi:MAG: hypothetical protein A2202_01580 [Bdellovibrionales bacterium RIFOXYA1_FULL_36_14]|nr:MAG: hypothetical protein A2202_01580 [Bdellovibrionales bacterium RIFOXYA1_FULL_36_14]